MDVKGHTVTPVPRCKNTCVGQAASRRLKQVAEYAPQGISVLSTLILLHLEHVSWTSKTSASFFGGIIICPEMSMQGLLPHSLQPVACVHGPLQGLGLQVKGS